MEELHIATIESLDEIVAEFASVQAINRTEADMRVDRQAYENSLHSFAGFRIASGTGH